MCPCVYVCIQACFVLYVIYSQHCKHTETIIHVLARIHWIWLTWLEHHKSSNDLGWMRTQRKIKIEGFWRAAGGPLKSPLLIVRLMFRSWWRSCHRVRKWANKSSSRWRDRMSTLLFPSSENNRFLVKEPSWLWRGWTIDQHKRETGGLFTQAFIEESMQSSLVPCLWNPSPFKVSASLCSCLSRSGGGTTLRSLRRWGNQKH